MKMDSNTLYKKLLEELPDRFGLFCGCGEYRSGMVEAILALEKVLSEIDPDFTPPDSWLIRARDRE
jgi:hypothetical protein